MISQKEITKLIKSDPCEACRLLKKSKSTRTKLAPNTLSTRRSYARQYNAPYSTNPYLNITQPLQPRVQTSPLEQMQQFAMMARASGLLPKEEVVIPVEKKEKVIRKLRTEPEAIPVGGFEASTPPPSLVDIYNQQDLKQDRDEGGGEGGGGGEGPISVMGEALQFPNYTDEDAYVIRNIDAVRGVKARDRTPGQKQLINRFVQLQKRNDFDDYVNSDQFGRR